MSPLRGRKGDENVMSIDEYNKLLERVNRGKSARSEHDLQVQCVNWFRLVYPQYAQLLFAIPNGGYRSKTTARYMKAEGQLAGVPDLFLAVAKHKNHGLWVEMKNGKAGRVSDRQTEMMKLLWEQGYECRIARSREDFEAIINEYLISV